MIIRPNACCLILLKFLNNCSGYFHLKLTQNTYMQNLQVSIEFLSYMDDLKNSDLLQCASIKFCAV